MAFRFSQAIDPDEVHKAFAEHGFAHISGVLPPENAQRIHKGLLEQTPWNLVFNQDSKHFDMSEEQLRTLQKQDLNRLQQAIFAQAEQGFQYSYHNYPIHDAVKAGQNEGHILHTLYEWLNSDEFLQFARVATGF
ncbi:MAG: hypothetical protein OEV02_09920, partial [Gammaproteobacteria bacterium]|nr:hypothetical protein [Gammaproteobacteria bacterium]